MNNNRWKLLIVIIFMLAAGVCYSCGRSREETTKDNEVLLQTLDKEAGETKALDSGDGTEGGEEGALPQQKCYVHICGEVANPGVYMVNPEDRIFQVVEAAGGFTDRAAKDYLNMAGGVSDGMKLTVPDQESVDNGTWKMETDTPSQENSSGDSKVNLNSATKEQLMTLRGVGEAKALDIIRYREEKGPFQKIEDIMKISGIKEAAFQKIKDDITVK